MLIAIIVYSPKDFERSIIAKAFVIIKDICFNFINNEIWAYHSRIIVIDHSFMKIDSFGFSMVDNQ